MKKSWDGRFKKTLDPFIEEFSSSIDIDVKLAEYDLQGSIAHIKMLGKVNVISKNDTKKTLHGLEEILQEASKGELKYTRADEDIHMAIERRLVEKIGKIGNKLHTARSRNDQIVLDERLYLRDEISEVSELIKGLQKTIINIAQKNIDVIIPGLTHMQHAQPVLFSHYLMAYFNMLDRDNGRLKDCFKRVNVMPLGAGAIAGTSFQIDRKYVAKLLGFPAITENSIDTVSDRDFILEFVSCSAILMMHLSRLCEDIVIYSSEEFGYVELDDSICTGSSMMPQKKNPDVAELIRGKTARVYGSLITLFTLMKALPLSYNRDMQEDKSALFDAVETVKICLRAGTKLLENIKPNRKRLENVLSMDFSCATEIADYLVRQSMAFRDAHKLVGRIVRYCIDNKKYLRDLTYSEFKTFSNLFSRDILNFTSPSSSVKSKSSPGGTCLKNVKAQIEKAKKSLSKEFAQ
ncbi:MAG: argininosuccinate lyase [bacterium]|nr:argininosuccinate lyase [bacterium]